MIVSHLMYTCFVFYIKTWKDHVLVFPAFGDWLLPDLEEQRHIKCFLEFHQGKHARRKLYSEDVDSFVCI